MIAKIEKAHREEIFVLNRQLVENENKAMQLENRIGIIRNEYERKVEDLRKDLTDIKKERDESYKEREKLSVQLETTEKKLSTTQVQFAEACATINTKTKFLDKRELELKQFEDKLRAEPPKLLDPTLKRSRDEAITALRNIKLEMGKLKEDIIVLTQKLQVAEGTVQELERQKQFILAGQNDLKESFITNLNHQQQKHEEDMKQKDNRIRELETILTSKIK